MLSINRNKNSLVGYTCLVKFSKFALTKVKTKVKVDVKVEIEIKGKILCPLKRNYGKALENHDKLYFCKE